MGSPHWKRLCLLLLAAFSSSLVLYGHYYATVELPAGQRIIASLLQPEPLLLAPSGTSHPAGSHRALRGSLERESFKPSSQPEERNRRQPSPCPRSVVEAARAHPSFGELFQFATPVLMWDQHFNPETWNRLKERHVPYGWQGLSHAAISSTLQLLNASANRQLFDRRRFPGGCVRCAVVGNGGILNGSRQGEAIDAHDLVFRWGRGRIEGGSWGCWGGPSPGHGPAVLPQAQRCRDQGLRGGRRDQDLLLRVHGEHHEELAHCLRGVRLHPDTPSRGPEVHLHPLGRAGLHHAEVGHPGQPGPRGLGQGRRSTEIFWTGGVCGEVQAAAPGFPTIPHNQVPALGAAQHAVRPPLHAQHRRPDAPDSPPHLRPGQRLRVHHGQLRAVLGPLLRGGEETPGVLRQPRHAAGSGAVEELAPGGHHGAVPALRPGTGPTG